MNMVVIAGLSRVKRHIHNCLLVAVSMIMIMVVVVLMFVMAEMRGEIRCMLQRIANTHCNRVSGIQREYE